MKDIGLAGVPYSGKSTLFTALTRTGAAGGRANQAVVPVPDPRLPRLAELERSERIVPAQVRFLDPPGGTSAQGLAALRATDALCLVLRAFGPDPNPAGELAEIRADLLLSDLAMMEGALENARRRLKGRGATAAADVAILERAQAELSAETPLSQAALEPEDRKFLRGLAPLTLKPWVVVANLEEGKGVPSDLPGETIGVYAEIEAETAAMPPAEARELLGEFGVTEPGLERVVAASYRALDLITFLTTGEDETRAWEVRRGARAPEAAGVVHSDMERGFPGGGGGAPADLGGGGGVGRGPAPGPFAGRGQGLRGPRRRRAPHQVRHLSARMSPMVDEPSKDARTNRRYWDRFADEYQDRHASQLNRRELCWGVWAIPESELNVLGDIVGRDILELGCGAAQWSIFLARRGARPVGLDNSRFQLAHAARLMREAGVRFPLVHASAERVPLAAERFDVVFCDHGGMSFADPTRTIAEAARVLRPGGLLAFNMASPILFLSWSEWTEAVEEKLQRPYFGMRRFEYNDGLVEYQLPYGEWIRLFRQNGFVVEDLIELRPPGDATTTYPEYVPHGWARRWPAENIWKVRKPNQ